MPPSEQAAPHAVDRLTEGVHRAGDTVVSISRRTGDGYDESVLLDPGRNAIEIMG